MKLTLNTIYMRRMHALTHLSQKSNNARYTTACARPPATIIYRRYQILSRTDKKKRGKTSIHFIESSWRYRKEDTKMAPPVLQQRNNKQGRTFFLFLLNRKYRSTTTLCSFKYYNKKTVLQ